MHAVDEAYRLQQYSRDLMNKAVSDLGLGTDSSPYDWSPATRDLLLKCAALLGSRSLELILDYVGEDFTEDDAA